MAARHRDASLLQQGESLGVPALRRNWRRLRLLAPGRGKAAVKDARGPEAEAPGEEEKKSREGCTGGSRGICGLGENVS